MLRPLPQADRRGSRAPTSSCSILVDGHRHEAGERELDEDDLGVLHLEEEVLDTRPILLEQLQLNIPMKPLCRPDCQGLCPQCGADLNLGACGCGERQVDPRWAALAALKGTLAGGGE